MKVQKFTLIIAPDPTEEEADKLYGIIDDGTLATIANIPQIHFHREATTMDSAIRSAIADVTSLGLNVLRVETEPEVIASKRETIMKESGTAFSYMATRLKKEKISLETLIAEETPQLAKSYNVLVLPENLDVITDEYFEPQHAEVITQQLKAHPNIKCGDVFDLDIDCKYIHKYSDEIWVGTIWILDKVVVPVVINVIFSLLKNRPSKFPQPKKKMHAEVIYYESGKIKKIAIQGEDEDGCRKMFKTIHESSEQEGGQ